MLLCQIKTKKSSDLGTIPKLLPKYNFLSELLKIRVTKFQVCLNNSDFQFINKKRNKQTKKYPVPIHPAIKSKRNENYKTRL